MEAELTFVSYKNYYSNWKERVGGECGFINTGFLKIVKREYEDKLRGNVANQQRIGINTSVISAAEVKELFPDLATDHFDFAAYEPDSGYADATLTTNSFLESAKRNGATLIQNCEVTAIHMAPGRHVTGVNTTQGDFDAPIVINAAGRWAKHVASLAGVEVPLETWTHDVAFLHRPPSLGKIPAVIDDIISCYFRQGSALILAASEDDSLRDDRPKLTNKRPHPSSQSHRQHGQAHSQDRRERLAVHPRRARRADPRPARHL